MQINQVIGPSAEPQDIQYFYLLRMYLTCTSYCMLTSKYVFLLSLETSYIAIIDQCLKIFRFILSVS